MKIKRIISAVFLVIFAVLLCSCGGILPGQGILYTSIKKVNTVSMLISDIGRFDAYKENIAYYDETGNVSFGYSVYIEQAQDTLSMYNVLEEIGDYKMVAYEGDIYTEKDGKICAVLNLNSTYYSYISGYLETEDIFDGGSRFQLSSSRDGDTVRVSYYTDVTPSYAVELTDFGIKNGDRIISEYVLDSAYAIQSVKYSVGNKLIMSRDFEYFTEKQPFISDNIPSNDNMIEVNIFVDDNETPFAYSVPVGYYIGIDSQNNEYEYYADKEHSDKYLFENGIVSENLTIYAKKVK